MTNVAASTSGIMANVNVVKEADLPTSWWDLADPKYKGKILWYDPTSTRRRAKSDLVLDARRRERKPMSS